MFKRTFLYGLLLAVLSIVPFTGAKVSASEQDVQVENVYWRGGWGGGIYVSPWGYGGYRGYGGYGGYRGYGGYGGYSGYGYGYPYYSNYYSYPYSSSYYSW
jgi:hypothetical protein